MSYSPRSPLSPLVIALSLAALWAPAVLHAQERQAKPAQTSDQGRFPVEIEHAFGRTVIEKKPERIATVGWGNQEVALAIGVVPVGMPKVTFGDDDGDGMLPWVEEKLEELGGESPVHFDESDGIDFEAVAATRPDVILAAYSGLNAAAYTILSQIAPVVAYPSTPWTTPWREMIELDSAGMGMAAAGKTLVEQLDAKIAAARSRHPELAGKTAMFITGLGGSDPSRINFYNANDPRAQFFGDLGLVSPPIVKKAAGDGRFFSSISAEQIDALSSVDVIVTYGDDDLLEAAAENPLLAKIPAVRDGAVVFLGQGPIATAANPTPLSVSWGVDAYADRLADAVAKRR